MSKSLGKRILAITLSVLMVMSLLPTGMFADDNGETTATVVATQTDSGTLTILSGADFTDETLYLYVNYEYTGDLDGDYIYYEPGYLCDSSWTNIIPISSYSSCGGTYVISLVELAETFTTAGYDVANGVVLNYWGQDYSSFTSAQLVSVASESGDSGESGETTATVIATQTDSGTLTILSGADFTDENLYLYINYEYTGDLDGDYIYYEPGYLCDSSWTNIIPISSYSSCGGTYVISLVELAETFTTAGYDVANGVVLNYWGQDYSSFTSAQLVSTASDAGESGGEEDPGTTSVLPWELTSTDYVNDWSEMTFYQTAINGFTYGGYQWSTLIQNNSSSNYSGSLALWDGFIEALLSDNATFEITSTSANTFIILQAGANFGYGLGVYVYADSVVDNGDGTYTTTISCASALSAFASATQEGYEGSPAVPTGTSDYGDLFGLIISSSDESATLTSFKIVDSTASSGGETGGEETEATDTSSWVVVLQGFNTEYGGWAYTTLSDAGVLSYSVPLQTILDANNLDLADLGGVQFSVNGLTLTEDRSAGISDGQTIYYRVYINDELYVSSSSEIVTDTTWSSYTFLTLNYEANFGWDNYYNYSADDVFYVEVSLTAFEEDEPATATLPWVDEPLAENNLTLSGQTWWTQLIICTEAASEEDYNSYVSTDMEGFLAAIAENDAVLEITSTGSGVDQIFFQYKVSDEVYDATDAISMTITDNGDGTYTSAVSGADLNALVTAFEAEGCSAWKLYINKTIDADTVLTSMQVVEGSVVVDEEFDLSSYTLWSTEEVNLTSGVWNSYSFTDGSWADALAYDGAILVITRDSTDYSSGYDNFFFQDSSNWSSLGLGSGTSSADISCTFDNGDMVVYKGSTVYNALASRGMSPDVFVSNSDADPTYTITSVSVYIPTATILAANQEMIDNLTALLLSYDDVVYINQSDAEDFNGYFSAGWSEICASSWDWDEIASIWTTSLGEEATVMIDYSDYVAPVAGTTDDLDGTDGSITLTYYAYVGDSEAGTYVASQTYTVTIVIKATQLYHIEIPTDPDGRFTVTPSTEYATEGEEVTITIETAEGYKVSEVRAWYQDENGNINSIGIGYNENTGGWFYMPAYDIWMDVTVGTLDVNYVYEADAVFLVDGVTAANEGEEVTFYMWVNRGYELDGEIIAVDESGNTVTLTEVYAGLSIVNYKPSTVYAYSFTMPDSSVTITATSFKAIDGFIDGAFYITDYGEISFIDQVDFTDSDTYLVISYDLMFESDENVDNYGDWSPGAIYAVNDNGEWIQLFSIPSYYSSNGTYAISLADIAALASDAGCNIDTYGVIINWWVNDDEYASNETFTLSNDYHEIVLMDSNGQVNISSRSYKQGDTATFTLDSLVDAPVISVTAVDSSGNSVEVTATDASNLEYTLTMPDSTVWITVTFADSYTSIVFQYGQCWDLSEGLFNSAFVDLDDENLYLRVEYVMTGDTDSYGEIQYSTDFENTVHLTEVPVNENGITFISLKALSEAASELGYDGYFLFGVDLGSFDVDQSLVSIVTIGEYTTEASKVGEVITIGNQDYEVVWDTTEVNPDGVAYDYHNILGWSAYGMHSNWWLTFESFKESLFNHLDDSSLIYIEGNEQTGKWLVVYNPDTYTSYEIPVGTYYDTDGTSVYMSIDEIVTKATEDGWDVETYFSAISHDAQENTVISAVRILTPLTYEVESTAWSVDMTSATLKLVAGNHVVYVDATDILSEVTEATCTTAGQVVYTATAAYNGQVFEVSTTATIPATGHTESAAVEENRVEATCTEDGSYDSVVYCSDCGEELSRETVTIPATGHTESAAVEENRVEATCTEDGSYDSVVYCSDCGEEISRETVTIPATGHSYVAVVTDPTCEEEGYTTYTCSVCGETYDDDYVAATGHSYGEPEWTWDGYTSATAKFTCENDPDHVVEVTATITPDTTPATCEEDGETVYTASITFDGTEYTSTETEVLPATDHDWSVEYTWSEDGKTCTATHVCANDAEHNVSETVTTSGVQSVAPTCTEKGTTTYTATFTSSWAETKTMDVVDIDALGHTEAEAVEENRVAATCTEDGSYDSVVYCSVCGEELSRETVTIPATGHTEAEAVVENRVEASCTEDGSYDSVVYCSVCGEELSRETTTIPATGHTEGEAVEENRVEATCTTDGSYDSVVYCSVCGEELSRETITIPAIGHNYGEPVWTWNGYTSATATFTCENDSTHVETITATITPDTTPATCEEDGETIYTATVTFEGTEYTSIETEVLTALGHDWTVSYEWTEDGKSCTATRSCANDSTHDVSETVTTVGAVTIDPTCEGMGTTTYTATFTADWAVTKTMDVQDVEALGHEWTVEYTWSEDGKSCTATHVCGRDSTHNESETVTTSGTETVAPTCTEKGTTTYTATFTADWAVTKTMDVADIDALGHTYGEPTFAWNTETFKATATFNCTVDGCDGSYTTEADVTSAVTNATCTEDGKTVYTAVVTFNNTEYTDTYEVAIPATGHTTEIQNAKAATCTVDGYTGDEVCTACGETIATGSVIPAAHSFGEDGICTVCGAKKDESSSTPAVTVESGDTIFAEVLPSGLVTEVEITLTVDGGTVIVSTVDEDDSNPHLVDHIADALEFTLFNESQGDDLVKDTNSFTITTTENNNETLKKVTILFYGDIDYDGNSAPVTMSFATSSSLRTSDIYVLHYTGVGTVWEVVSSTTSATGKQLTVDFDATSFSPYVVVAVSNASSGGNGSTIIDILMRISADYTAVNDAIATANALDPADYVDFSAVTAAINSVDWTVNALNQATVDAYALAINNAIDSLVKVTAEESVEIVEPIEGTDTDTEADEAEDESEPEASEEANPTTGLALSLIPMAIAALAAVATKRK